jgi:hypothetical protein
MGENENNDPSCPSMNQKQIDIVIASYAAERADCAAMFGASTNILGFAVSSLGLAIIFLPNPEGVPEEWLFLISSIPWALLAHHSIMAGATSGHAFQCREYERLIAKVAPDPIVYKEHENNDEVIFGSSIGERYITPRVARFPRWFAWHFSMLLLCGLPALYSSSIILYLFRCDIFWGVLTSVVALAGLVVVAVNHRDNVVCPEIHEIRRRNM